MVSNGGPKGGAGRRVICEIRTGTSWACRPFIWRSLMFNWGQQASHLALLWRSSVAWRAKWQRANCPHLWWRQRNLALRLVLMKTQIAGRGWGDPRKSVRFLFSPTEQLPLRPAKLKHTAITAGTLHNFMTPSNIPCQQCASSTKRADSWAGRRAETSMQINPGYISAAPETLDASRFLLGSHYVIVKDKVFFFFFYY